MKVVPNLKKPTLLVLSALAVTAAGILAGPTEKPEMQVYRIDAGCPQTVLHSEQPVPSVVPRKAADGWMLVGEVTAEGVNSLQAKLHLDSRLERLGQFATACGGTLAVDADGRRDTRWGPPGARGAGPYVRLAQPVKLHLPPSAHPDAAAAALSWLDPGQALAPRSQATRTLTPGG